MTVSHQCISTKEVLSLNTNKKPLEFVDDAT